MTSRPTANATRSSPVDKPTSPPSNVVDSEVPVTPAFVWTPPDLRVGGPWYQTHIANLGKAVQGLPDPVSAYKQGLHALDLHRENYNAEGPSPSTLQILWWEFPREHWTDLREGSRMNFAFPPSPAIHDNAHMDVGAMEVAGAFVDELADLGVLLEEDDKIKVLLNAPLFCVPKEGQPGEWRVIADMLRGGQNSCMTSDHVYLPRSTHILSQMYTGGYTAVVDASKFFYQFTTHPEDRPYLGLVHPITGMRYAYGGLPMGAGNSPALAGRYGLSFIRLL
jgi:hypothetical protein